jgi:hypothetical protein
MSQRLSMPKSSLRTISNHRSPWAQSPARPSKDAYAEPMDAWWKLGRETARYLPSFVLYLSSMNWSWPGPGPTRTAVKVTQPQPVPSDVAQLLLLVGDQVDAGFEM